MLTERIEKSSGEEKKQLEELRTKLLDYVNEIDRQVEIQLKQARDFIEQLLVQPDVQKAVQENIDMFNELTMQVLEAMYREAQQKKDIDRLNKIQQIIMVLQQASAPPHELEVVQKMLGYDEEDFDKALNENDKEITPQFMEMFLDWPCKCHSKEKIRIRRRKSNHDKGASVIQCGIEKGNEEVIQ
jgi:hypothetical protein